ncbi:uncharacterized protein LOC129091807 [Anoplopoma fimbria]|uniref:uncharacterized protein LOC129091807 n=1 Tax=Anoplopoma fimbria TaxID=229290 RepID=UPI0023EDA8AF|nr:uncharacterized protein LOC129091807 [Anoplopoma fimbria]
MDESALERYFDKFIDYDSSKMETEELSGDLSSLPDELLTLFKDDTESRTESCDSSTSLDYSSQNPTAAAELPDVLSPAVRPVTPVTPETHQPVFHPQIKNVISTVKLGCYLDLLFIARRTWNVEYKPEVPVVFQVFKALIMRIRRPPTTALFYRSGFIVCSGAKSEEQSRLSARKYCRIVQNLGFPVRFLDFKIRNIVANCKTFPVRLEQLAYHQPCSYEPELFPGLFYNSFPGISITIFSSGKMFLSGAKKEDEVYEMLHTVCRILKGFRRL